ncbi:MULTISPECIES: hypothetical protein [Cryobacterium]|uniref:Uncharacterized protein n=1 Tax=Cryobacterium breve TaxID=1259258 RepID=A0ABY2IWS5_9MICO|nr:MULTISPECIES: hypothetical protein [Cryobacterium]TFC94746.1 hypothetical protein E3T20_07170 [Cryobacterium sp. TmT3-12]TFC96364.1 hypothetical protein E3O65_13440 [Cryobacterium breve]
MAVLARGPERVLGLPHREVTAIGGWPDAIGEDIVMIWRLLEQGTLALFVAFGTMDVVPA